MNETNQQDSQKSKEQNINKGKILWNILNFIVYIGLLLLIYHAGRMGVYEDKIDHCSGFPYKEIQINGTTCYQVCPPQGYSPEPKLQEQYIDGLGNNWSIT